jgi:hypothetical protein
MMVNDASVDLFEVGRMYFKAFAAEFAAYGIPPDPRMELRPGTGMLCYYDLNDGHIYLSVPDMSSPMGRLQATIMGSLLSCDTEEEFLRLLRIFIPRIVAHEMAHHLRHRHGVFGTNMWHEEQVANQLAVAVTKHRMSPEEKRFARDILRRALDGLSGQVDSADATMTYYNVLHALNASGKLPDSALERIEVAQRLFEMSPEDFEDSVDLTASQSRVLERRDDMIGQINEEYAKDFIKYMYYHAGWLYLDLTGHGAEYVDEFARLHLNVATPILPPIEAKAEPTPREIYACYRAYLDVLPASQAAARFFYKRYRRLLWGKMQSVELPVPAQTERLKAESTFFLESWDEGESDALGYLAHLAPQELRSLFPNRIASYVDPGLLMQAHLPTETDRRLWRHIALHDPDNAAAHTLYRLTLLDHTDVFRPMPAESMLELVASLCRVRLAVGETIIWESDINDDVFFLLQGRLEVLVAQNNSNKRVGTVYPGEVFGEMAFFSRDTRNATVRAIMPSECFVIKDSALLSLVFKHPSILMQMAGALAKRLARLNQRAALSDLKVDSVRG